MGKINGKIYKITNKINGKVYIGQTTRTLPKRIKEHTNAFKYKNGHKSAISKAINKYGIDNFEIEVIDFADNHEDLNKKECMHINNSQTMYPLGYNLRQGGNQSGVSEITINRQRASQIKLNRERGSAQHPRSKKVINTNTGEIFSNVKEVCKIYNINYSTLKPKLQGKCGNNTPFRYLESKKFKKYIGSGNNQGKKVINKITGEIYKNAKIAAEKNGLSASTLRHNLVYRVKNYKGLEYIQTQ